jgi:hypothetical protein
MVHKGHWKTLPARGPREPGRPQPDCCRKYMAEQRAIWRSAQALSLITWAGRAWTCDRCNGPPSAWSCPIAENFLARGAWDCPGVGRFTSAKSSAAAPLAGRSEPACQPRRLINCRFGKRGELMSKFYSCSRTACIQCNARLIAPTNSEYVSERHVRHSWLCESCSHYFVTSDYLKSDKFRSLPSLVM